MLSIKKKILAYKCARCFREDSLKLAWFVGSVIQCIAIAYFVIHALKINLKN
jgi:hypothetical protein